jgi:hypothetical protein
MSMMPTYDYESEQSDLMRRLKIAEAMQQGGLAPLGGTETVSGVAVKRSPLEAVAKIAQAYFGSKQVQSIGDQQRQLGQRYRDDMRTGVGALIEGVSTQPGQIPEVADESGGHGGAPMTAADATNRKRQAVMQAIASNHPVLQQLGMQQLQAMQKEGVSVKDVFGHATPEAQEAMARTGSVAGFKAKREKPIEVGGMLLDSNTLEVLEAKGPVPKQVSINGDLYEINPTTKQYKKLDNAPKVNVNTTVSPIIQGQKAGFEEWSKKAAQSVDEMSASARQSVKLMSQLNQLEALSNAGTNAGPTAGIATFVQGLAKTAGIQVDPKMLNNSQAFESVATQAWAALMQQNGGARGLVKEESEKLAQSLPSLIQTPQGRKQITAVLRQQAVQNIEDAKKANAEYGRALQTQDPAAYTFGLSSTILPQSGPNPSATGAVSPGTKKPSVSNW